MAQQPHAEPMLSAFLVGDPAGWVIEPASPRRRWMDEFADGFAYRCLPLAIANQCGWVVRAPVGLSATWYGGAAASDTRVRFDENPALYQTQISSHFGGGVLTFSLPWLFRTPPGVCLWVRGLPNQVRPGAQALDGVVETHWSPMTFTMNWQLLDAGRPVRFERGDAVAFLTPLRLDLVESVAPVIRPIDDDPALASAYRAWSQARSGFIQRTDRAAGEWQKDYMAGRHVDGTPEASHKTRLKVRPFDKA